MKAACIKAVFGCDLIAETFPARMERGVGLPRIDRVPYVPDLALNLLGSYEAVVLAGAAKPVTFFGYKDTPASLLGAGQEVVALGEGPDALAELGWLAEALGAPSTPPEVLLTRAGENPLPTGVLTRQGLHRANGPATRGRHDGGQRQHQQHVLPIISLLSRNRHAARADGSAIGPGGPCATGAAVACPDRKVINFQADGSALYTCRPCGRRRKRSSTW